MQKAALSALPAVRALGRHAGRDPLTLYWTASGIELLFDVPSCGWTLPVTTPCMSRGSAWS